MSFAPESVPQSPRDTEALTDPKALLRLPVGLVSPLWPLFAGAAVSGAAWWWMTRWAQPDNLEAMFAAVAKAEAEKVQAIEAVAEPILEAAVEAAPAIEAAAEAVVEAAPEPVLEALAEAPLAPEPVGGESAPISPVVAAMTPEAFDAEAVKPKKKPAIPRAD